MRARMICTQSAPSTRSIPVYDKETMQVVDSFTLRG